MHRASVHASAPDVDIGAGLTDSAVVAAHLHGRAALMQLGAEAANADSGAEYSITGGRSQTRCQKYVHRRGHAR